MNASEIARIAAGRLEGGADPEISGAAPLDHAGPGDVALLSSTRYVDEAAATSAGLVLVTPDLEQHVPAGTPRIVAEDPHAVLAAVLPVLYPPAPRTPQVHPTAVIEEGVQIGADVSIGAYSVIGAGTRLGHRAVVAEHVVIGRLCRIGEDAYLHPHVTLYEGVVIGSRSILHSGARAGVEGFGYVHQQGRHVKVPQVGGCVIGDDVEIGANTTIDRGSVGSTVIGSGSKIDNLVHVGHNVRLGEHTIIIAQVGIAGSTRSGRYVTYGGQAGINGHIRIGDGASIAGQAGVFGDVPAGETVSGYPARPHREALRAQAGLFRLPALMKRLAALERTVRAGEEARSAPSNDPD